MRAAHRLEDPGGDVGEDEDQDDDDGNAAELEYDFDGSEDASRGAVKVLEVTRVPPQWDPDMNLSNLLFELADAAGKDGLSSMVQVYTTSHTQNVLTAE